MLCENPHFITCVKKVHFCVTNYNHVAVAFEASTGNLQWSVTFILLHPVQCYTVFTAGCSINCSGSKMHASFPPAFLTVTPHRGILALSRKCFTEEKIAEHFAGYFFIVRHIAHTHHAMVVAVRKRIPCIQIVLFLARQHSQVYFRLP